MAEVTKDASDFDGVDGPIRIVEFGITGLFGMLDYTVPFPEAEFGSSDPQILILSGQNGSGKTTILRMIDGMRTLNLDPFRRVPFKKAWLKLSNGDVLRVDRTDNEAFPLHVEFGDTAAELVRNKRTDNYSQDEDAKREAFRTLALSVLSGIDYELIETDRNRPVETKSADLHMDLSGRISRKNPERNPQSNRVREFLQEAQVNYRKFFQVEDIELLPRILRRFTAEGLATSADNLLQRLQTVRNRNLTIKHFGLQTDDADLDVLEALLKNENYNSEIHALTLMETYVEMHENIAKHRDLLVRRLKEFESVMDEFLFAKKIRVHARHGLQITTQTSVLDEDHLSSGESHFLYMMVSALLCQRQGSVLAIDEPELSLHVLWQRRLVSALSRCAAGAAPLFLFCTHSTAIAAEHLDKVFKLSEVE